MSKIVSLVSTRVKYILLCILFLYLFVFLGFPYWSGLISTGDTPPTNSLDVGIQVKVPDYYYDAGKWLSEDIEHFRYASFPLGGEGVVYNWEKGYNGVELSPLFFNKPGITSTIDLPLYHRIASSLEKNLITSQDFYKIAGMLNLKYLLLRPDIDYKRSNLRDPYVIEKLLDQKVASDQGRLELVKEFLPLKFYRISDQVFMPKIYPGGDFIVSNEIGNLDDINLVEGSNSNDILYSSSAIPQEIAGKEIANIVHNDAFYFLNDSTFPIYTEAPYIFPYTNKLPGTNEYKFILAKEKVQKVIILDPEKRINFEILLLGKRLFEVKNALLKNEISAGRQALNLYNSEMPNVLKKMGDINLNAKLPDERIKYER